MTTGTGWSEDMGTAYCAGLDGLPCPNDFRACWEQGVAHREGRRYDPDHPDVMARRASARCQACGVHDDHSSCTGENTLGTAPCACWCRKVRRP